MATGGRATGASGSPWLATAIPERPRHHCDTPDDCDTPEGCDTPDRWSTPKEGPMARSVLHRLRRTRSARPRQVQGDEGPAAGEDDGFQGAAVRRQAHVLGRVQD